MKICILGAGALGCALGGVLTEAGNEVWLINRNKAHIEAMRNKGLVLRDGCRCKTAWVMKIFWPAS